MPTTTPHVYPVGVECRKSDPPNADPARDSSLPGPPAHAPRRGQPPDPAAAGFQTTDPRRSQGGATAADMHAETGVQGRMRPDLARKAGLQPPDAEPIRGEPVPGVCARFQDVPRSDTAIPAAKSCGSV